MTPKIAIGLITDHRRFEHMAYRQDERQRKMEVQIKVNTINGGVTSDTDSSGATETVKTTPLAFVDGTKYCGGKCTEAAYVDGVVTADAVCGRFWRTGSKW